MKKLKDYPQIPATPPPSDKRDKGLALLEEELEQEKKYLYALCTENKELEDIVQNLDKEIVTIKSNFPNKVVGDGKIHASNEFWFKFESQMELVRKLEREKKCLEGEIRQIEEHGLINLDSLSQSELIMYVKQLERTKTNLLSDLRSKEWGLDKQARDIHHLNEMKRALQAEIRHYDKEFSMYRHYKKNACPSAGLTERRNSFTAADRKMKTWKQPRQKCKAENTPTKLANNKKNSQSQENIATTDSKSDVMFSSLDEAKLREMECERTPGYQRRTDTVKPVVEKKRVAKGPARKSVGMAFLPEIGKGGRSKTQSPVKSKTREAAAENKVGTQSHNVQPSTPNSEPIKIIVAYQTQRKFVGESKEKSEDETTTSVSSPERGRYVKFDTSRSVEESYEGDLEGSPGEGFTKEAGYLTTRV